MAYRDELSLDTTLVEEWLMRASFAHPEHDIDEAVKMSRIDASTCNNDPRFIIIHNGRTGVLDLITMGMVIGSQHEALQRTSLRYGLILGKTAASQLIIASMNVESVVSAHQLPHLEEAYEALDEPEFTQIELNMLTGAHAPEGLLVTGHVRNFLAALEC